MPIHHHADNPSPQRKPNSIFVSLLLKPIIMLFLFSLFLFLGIAAVSILFLLLAGSSLHLCRHLRRRSTATATLSVEELRKYLPPGLNYDGRVESVRECAVCLECLKEGEWCRRLPDCNHVFHLSCVDSWLTKVFNCPICRAPVCFHSCGSRSFVGEIDDFKLCRGIGLLD